VTLFIHEDARQHFNNIANEAHALAHPGTPPERTRLRPASLQTDERDIATISDEDLVPDSVRLSFVDLAGKRTGLYFTVGGAPYGLDGDGIERFEQLLSLLRRQRKLYMAIGPRLLSDSLVGWIGARLGGTTTPEFSDWLLERANATIQPRLVLVPLENFRSESAFDFAGVRFDHRVVTRAMFDAHEAEWRRQEPDRAMDIAVAIKRHRHWFQGQTCGIVSIDAEPGWASTSATELVRQAFSVLRLYSPSAFLPGYKCAVGLAGRVCVPGDVSCEFTNGQVGRIHDGTAEGFERVQWLLTDAARSVCMPAGLSVFEQLLLRDRPNELEEAVLHALRLLDESVCCNDLHKRAALALTAAESLLLQTDSEPIQVMLGLRCGRLTRRTATERLAVDRTIKHAYELRSGYVHHGRTEADPQLLKDLHCMLLDAFAAVSRLTQSLKTRVELFDRLQDLLLR
jgi:hypothetical protein